MEEPPYLTGRIARLIENTPKICTRLVLCCFGGLAPVNFIQSESYPVKQPWCKEKNESSWNLRMFNVMYCTEHDDVIKWKHFPRYWPFVRGIHRSPVNSPYKGQWRGVLMFSLICTRINGWVSNGEAGDLRRYHAHYDVTVMKLYTRFVLCHGLIPGGAFTNMG